MAIYTENRPWGQFAVLDEGQGYKVKRVTVMPGKRLSYQYHNYRHEHWIVVEGTVTITLDGKELTLQAGDYINIPIKAHHRMGNNTAIPMSLIEIQRGSRVDEDDIVRLEDDFGRE
ncbi:MAG: mannose-6-phosphate isomerase [Deltaproteobacteria bacterium CG11_big_fil_rev_8_21_14_0_20_47_16]|nr:MAG: mannose-6-phosphate isomerase [Deltaproteobacteria bacterium CG11_big_fil_rev_8_21_14_0_20_47_16]